MFILFFMIFKILPQSSGQRLDKFLSGQTELSRSQIQKLIKQQGLLINQKRTKAPHYFLKEGDRLNADFAQHKLEKNNQAIQTNIDRQIEPVEQPSIIYNCSDYAIINKPAGLLAHHLNKTRAINYSQPGNKASERLDSTLVDWLIKKFPEIQKVGDEPHLRPGLVHRLDKEVSGVMVITKTEKMFLHLKEQFKQRQIKKEYLALVYGQIAQNEGLINFPIGRSKKGIKMAARPLRTSKIDQEAAIMTLRSIDQDGQARTISQKPAETYFTVIKKFQPYTFLKVSPKTGRTNQIRVHLNAIGHPIVGEKIYIPKNLKKKQKFDRLFLHSHKLGFCDLDGQWKEYQSALPDKLRRFAKI